MQMMLAARRLTRRAAAAVLMLAAAACGDGPSTPNRPNPTPGLSAVSPVELLQGSGAVTLTVTGTDFVQSSVVRWNGTDRPTTYVSSTQLTAAIPATDLEQAGMVQVSVFNPTPGGGVSNVVAVGVAPRPNPQPLVNSLDPDSVPVNTAVEIVVHGSGFVPSSLVWLDSGPASTTYVSPTQLRATVGASHVAVARPMSLWVQNPPPGGGTSAPRVLQVVNPAPVASSLAPATSATGQDSLVVRVLGSGFMAPSPFGEQTGSVVHVNGGSRTTRFVNAGELAVTLSSSDLALPGTLSLTVANPGPGGGTSGPLTLTLTNAAPQVTLLPSFGAHAGRPGFALMVHGTGFVRGSVVRINGTDRATQYVGPTRLETVLTAGDLAAPGSMQVSVRTPAPGGGTSGSVTLTVRAVPASTVTSTRSVAVSANDLVYDPGTQRLYVSVRSDAAAYASQVIAVDPATGAVGAQSISLAGPRNLVLADDGSSLWVAVNNGGDLRRLTLPSLTPGLQFSLNGSVVEELRAMPGRAGSVAISLSNTCCSPRHEGVAIYDDGVRRATATPGHTGANSIDFGESASVLYGYNNETTEFGFRTIAVTSAGASEVRNTGGIFGSFYVRIRYASGRVYGTDGTVVDAGRHVKVGSLASGGPVVLPDPVLGRVFVLSDAGIRVYDMNTFQLLGTVNAPGAGDGWALTRWGSDGLAFLTDGGLRIVRSPLAGGASPAAYRRRR